MKKQQIFIDDKSPVKYSTSAFPGIMTEETRPTLYRGLKYWGKKPHNIWREIIQKHTKKGDIVYDPFAGSALTFFEAIKTGRKPVVADVNPITLFLVDVYSKRFNLKNIEELAVSIIKKAKAKKFYKKHFTTKCSFCGENVDIYNYRVEDRPNFMSYKCSSCLKTVTDKADTLCSIRKSKLWKPKYDLTNLSSVDKNFIGKIGGANISNLWTDRNLELLSFIFSEIQKVDTEEKDALMFGFMQILHLTTKMCALRSEETNRPLSTSWGRPAFLGLKSYMEQNPVVQFERAIFGNSGVLKCLKSRNEYLPEYTYSTDINDIDLVDGVVLLEDSKNIFDGFKPKLVITDPPYGSIIQYGELSLVWNVWLEQFSPKFKTLLSEEIIVNKRKSYKKYIDDMTKVLANCRDLLYPDGVLILTFNSNNNEDWVALDNAIKKSEMVMTNKLHQKNKRTSEANVYNKEGLGVSDFYISLERKIRIAA